MNKGEGDAPVWFGRVYLMVHTGRTPRKDLAVPKAGPAAAFRLSAGNPSRHRLSGSGGVAASGRSLGAGVSSTPPGTPPRGLSGQASHRSGVRSLRRRICLVAVCANVWTVSPPALYWAAGSGEVLGLLPLYALSSSPFERFRAAAYWGSVQYGHRTSPRVARWECYCVQVTS